MFYVVTQVDSTLQSDIAANPGVRWVSNLSCVGLVTGTRILNSIEFRRIIQTQPTLYVGVNLVPGPQIRVKRDLEDDTGQLVQVRRLRRLGEGT